MSPFDSSLLAEKLLASRRDEYCMRVEAASQLEKYPAKHHARRVRDKLDVGEGLIYLPGAPTRNNEDSDMPAPFRQRRYFYYLSGCNEPNCYLTYDIQHDILALFIPRINPARVIWNGRGSTPAEAMDKYDIDEVHYVDDLNHELLQWQMRYSGCLYVLHKEHAPRTSQKGKNIDSTSLLPAMNLSRMVKDEHEISLIRKANDISSEAHKQVLANVLSFKNEAQVEGLFLDVCVSRQAKQQAYDPIAASGPNAGTLHYDANNEDFGDRQLMCLDAGCEFELYASDITRTFPLTGSWPSQESKNIYKLVQRMQDSCIERLAPGVRYLDLHILAHQIAIDGLLRLGILHNGTSEEIYKAGTSRAFFPHGLGHHVGLEVHDVGQKELMSFYETHAKFEMAPSLYPEEFHLPIYDSEMCRAPTNPESPHLEEGMVVTVEPGIYFSTYALTQFYLPSPIHSKYINKEVVKRYLPVGGVRIEDDILITTKGYENLTTAPKGEDMLAIIRTQNANLTSAVSSKRSKSAKSLEEGAIEPQCLAPGIPKKPLFRASTEPLSNSTVRGSMDFEPSRGPSLFSEFQDAVRNGIPKPSSRHAVQKEAPSSKAQYAAQIPIDPQLYATDDAHDGRENVRQLSPRIRGSIFTNQSLGAHRRSTFDVEPRRSHQVQQTPIYAKDIPTPTVISSNPHMDRSRGTSNRTKATGAPTSTSPRRSVTFDDHKHHILYEAPSLNPWAHSIAHDSYHPSSHNNSHKPSFPHASVHNPRPSYEPQHLTHRHSVAEFSQLPRTHLDQERNPRFHLPPPPAPRPDQARGNTRQQLPFIPSSSTAPNISYSRDPRNSTMPTLPHRQLSLQSLRHSNPYRESAAPSHVGHYPPSPPRPTSKAATAPEAPIKTHEQRRLSQQREEAIKDQKLEELRKAMDELWRVKEDVERTFGEVSRERRRG